MPLCACDGETPAAWISPVNLAQTRGRLDERMNALARGRVARRDAHLVSGVPQDLRRPVGVVVTHVGQLDMLTHADPPRDRLADLTRSDDDGYLAHSQLRLEFPSGAHVDRAREPIARPDGGLGGVLSDLHRQIPVLGLPKLRLSIPAPFMGAGRA